jgi:hypothetical protein
LNSSLPIDEIGGISHIHVQGSPSTGYFNFRQCGPHLSDSNMPQKTLKKQEFKKLINFNTNRNRQVIGAKADGFYIGLF